MREADAVIENYLPSQAAALGVERLRAANPECVWVSVTSATSGGPLADRPCFDLLAQARSGLMGVTGDAEGDPAKVGAPVADVVTGLYAAIALLAGLVARSSGRPGRRFEVAAARVAMSRPRQPGPGVPLDRGRVPAPGNDHPSIAPYGPFPTADGLLLIAVGTDGQYARLVEVAGRPRRRGARRVGDQRPSRVASLAELRAELVRAFGAASDRRVVRAPRRGRACPRADIRRGPGLRPAPDERGRLRGRDGRRPAASRAPCARRCSSTARGRRSGRAATPGRGHRLTLRPASRPDQAGARRQPRHVPDSATW